MLQLHFISEARGTICHATTRVFNISREFYNVVGERGIDLKYNLNLFLDRNSVESGISLPNLWQDSTHAEVLAKAQERAKRLVHDCTQKLKRHHMESKRKAVSRRASCKSCCF